MESDNAKFKVGDWIISNSDMQFNIIAEITSIRNSLYYIRNIYGNEGYETWDSLRDNYHVWTICSIYSKGMRRRGHFPDRRLETGR